MTTSIYYIVAAAVVLLLLIVWGVYRYSTRNIVVWWHENSDDDELVEVPTEVSVVVISENDGVSLEQYLPALMEQRGVNMEVIVVNAASTDSTSDALKRLKATYPQLRQTYVPLSNTALDLRDFASVLGAKAARNEWVLVMHADFCPPSEYWLLDLLQYADDTVCAVVDYGHVTYDYDDEPSQWGRWRAARKMARLARRGRAIAAASGSVLVQKSWLLDRSGESASGECVYLYNVQWPWDRLILRARSRRPGAFRW